MQIETGLFPHMVLQRKTSTVRAASFAGSCASEGRVEARVTLRGRVTGGYDWAIVGQAKRGRFSGSLDKLKPGGPYDVELRIRSRSGSVDEATKIADILVGDVWILAGQSNMEGVGWLDHALKPVAKVRAYYMDNTWGIARDPLHNLWCAHAPVHGGDITTSRLVKDRRWSVGPGVAFGQDMLKASGVPQGLIACAHGGTTMEQWSPDKKKLGANSLYGAMLERFSKTGASVRGVVWYQGCSDTNEDAAKHYPLRMKRLIASMRRDFANPSLPVAMAQIGRFFFGAGNGEWWNSIQEEQRKLPHAIKHLAVVPTNDLPMDDGIHLGGDGQAVLGRRLAYAVRVLLHGRKAGLPPIEVDSITGHLDIRRFLYRVEARFRNVAGCLVSKDAPWGFNHGGQPNKVFRTTLRGNAAILMVSGIEKEMTEKGLQYGYGFQPFCNITDKLGRPLPTFGPLPIDMSGCRRFRPVNKAQIQVIDAEWREAAHSFPRKWKAKTEATSTALDSWSLINPWNSLGKKVQGTAFFRFQYDAQHAGMLKLHVGYDGPLRIWHDGEPVFSNPEGCRPAMPDDATIKLKASKGKHEVIAALGARGGWATGLFLTLEASAAAMLGKQE